jgi:hypothetical protein
MDDVQVPAIASGAHVRAVEGLGLTFRPARRSQSA